MDVWRRATTIIGMVTLAFATAACGSGDEPLTTAEMFEKLEGRPLTEAEVAERLALADFLCGFEGPVLQGVWDRLDADSLEFQDWVFGEHCPERLSAYESARPETGTAPTTAATSTTRSTTSTTLRNATTSTSRRVLIPDRITPDTTESP